MISSQYQLFFFTHILLFTANIKIASERLFEFDSLLVGLISYVNFTNYYPFILSTFLTISLNLWTFYSEARRRYSISC